MAYYQVQKEDEENAAKEEPLEGPVGAKMASRILPHKSKYYR